MENFKLYLIEQIKILEKKLEELKKAIIELPPEANFPLEEYGSIKCLKKEYHQNIKRPFIKRLLFVSKKDLVSYVRNNELNKLLTEKRDIEQVIYELNEATLSINGGKIQNELSRSNELIKRLFAYSEISNLPSADFAKILIIILKHTKRDKHVTSRIMQNISSFYDEDGNLLSKDNFGTIKLLFSKLFMSILTDEEQDKYLITINELIANLRIEHAIEEEPETRESLLKEKESLQALRQYIQDGLVIKTTSTIEEFEALLEAANIERSIANTLVLQMQQRIKEERKMAEELQKQQIIQEYLTEEEIAYVKKAIELEHITTGAIQSLINRTKNDIFSLCKYLDFVKGTDEYHSVVDILSRRIDILKELITNLETNKKEKNVFYYLSDDEQMPFLLRTIESLDITSYREIYNLLYSLANRTKRGKLKTVAGGINIYEIEDKNYIIEYTLTSSEIIILNAYSKTLASQISNLTDKNLARLKELMTMPKTKDIKYLHYQYESMILEALNLDTIDKPLHLLKKER